MIDVDCSIHQQPLRLGSYKLKCFGHGCKSLGTFYCFSVTLILICILDINDKKFHCLQCGFTLCSKCIIRMKQSTSMEIEENEFPNNKFLLHYDNSFKCCTTVMVKDSSISPYLNNNRTISCFDIVDMGA
jgi:hypothetical protein